MSENKNILDQLKKRKKPEVPEGFFTRFSENIIHLTNEENSFIEDLATSQKPDVPDGFFDSFPDKMLKKVKEEKPERGRIIPLGVWATLTSAAAVLAVVLWINQGNNDTNELSENTATEEYSLQDEDYDAYLTYVDEGEIIDFMIENDVSIEDDGTTSYEDDVYDYLGDDLEELYLEL